MAQLSFYDPKNPIRVWMEYGRSNQAPVLDEDDDDGDVPLPSHIVSDQIDPKDLRDATGADCISDWARKTVGDSHLGKRKERKAPKGGDVKRQKGKKVVSEKFVGSDDETEDGDGHRSPPYQESHDSSAATDNNDDDDDDCGDGGGGDGAGGGGGGGGGGNYTTDAHGRIIFTCTNCT
ncbi:unnamed protein product [Urochloa humidicola]